MPTLKKLLDREEGITQVLVLVFLLAGLLVAVYLVKTQTFLKPKADVSATGASTCIGSNNAQATSADNTGKQNFSVTLPNPADLFPNQGVATYHIMLQQTAGVIYKFDVGGVVASTSTVNGAPAILEAKCLTTAELRGLQNGRYTFGGTYLNKDLKSGMNNVYKVQIDGYSGGPISDCNTPVPIMDGYKASTSVPLTTLDCKFLGTDQSSCDATAIANGVNRKFNLYTQKDCGTFDPAKNCVNGVAVYTCTGSTQSGATCIDKVRYAPDNFLCAGNGAAGGGD